MTTGHIHLFGNPEENFFSLGKKDKNSFQEIYSQISMLCARNSALAQMLKLGTEYYNQFFLKQKHPLMNEIEAYASGLERAPGDVIYALLLPEFVAAFNKWTPQLVQMVPGCSSLFYLDKKSQNPIHARILDYALSGPFEQHERAILYDFKDKYKVLSFSTSGMPFPSLTGFNEKGLSLALHYKHGDSFDRKGESIFFITQEILHYCADIREALKLIKGKKSASYWGIYLSDSNGEVVSIDINGHDIYREIFDLNDHDYLYFNNRPLLHRPEQQNLQPYGIHDQCQMRRERVEQLVHKIPERNLDSSIKLLGEIHKTKSLKKWKLGPLTPASVQLVSMEAKNQSALFIKGPAPKFNKSPKTRFEKVFDDFEAIEIKGSKKLTQLEKVYQRLAKFQSHLDLAHMPQAYHQIQMAIEELDERPEKYICQFYFYAIEYVFESDKRELSYLLNDLESLIGKLPTYLEDHRQLFILRLTKLIGLNPTKLSPEIKNEQLQLLYQRELKLNTLGLIALKRFIFPRIEILDIIYAY